MPNKDFNYERALDVLKAITMARLESAHALLNAEISTRFDTLEGNINDGFDSILIRQDPSRDTPSKRIEHRNAATAFALDTLRLRGRQIDNRLAGAYETFVCDELSAAGIRPGTMATINPARRPREIQK